MKAWKKIIAMIALVASLGLICYTVLIGWWTQGKCGEYNSRT